MRKQYHFWPSRDGLLAWDVERLIELSKNLPRRPLRVAQVPEIDQVYWFDSERHRPTCRALVEHMRLTRDADLAYPIILARDGRVMDGMHRVAKAVLECVETIEAVQFRVDPAPDYIGRQPEELPY